MNAAKKIHPNWESINEERLSLISENLIVFSKVSLERFFLTMNIAAFVIYKLTKLVVFAAKAISLSQPIVRVEREESWLFRQVK